MGQNVAVVYSTALPIGGGGVGDVAAEAVRGLLKRGFLKRLLTLDGQIAEAADRTARFPVQLVRNRVANRFLPDFARDAIFDRWASRRVADCNVFYGWTGQALHSIRRAQCLAAVTLLDRGVVEVRIQKAILDEEHRRYGVPVSPLFRREVERIHAECEEVDVIVVPSTFVYDTFRRQGYPESKLWLCPLGVDTERFSPAARTDEVFRVLFLGRIGLQKGIVYLLRAWERLDLARAELVIMGPPGSLVEQPGKNVVLREIERIDRRDVRLVPPTSQPEKALQQASVLVLPSIQDGFGLVVLEAMACGVPVIVSSNVGAKECVRDGVDGFVVPARDPRAIAERLEWLYADETRRDRMGLSAREQAMKYTWDAYRERLLGKIEAAAGRVGGHRLAGAEEVSLA